MANPEHLAILKQGVEVWNKWREKNRNLDGVYTKWLDLTGANLANSNLRGVDLSYANLANINLRETDLSRANLRYVILDRGDVTETDFSDTDLYCASLEGTIGYASRLIKTNLYGAKMSGSSFHNSDFSRANLSRAILYGANLEGSDFRLTILIETELGDVNLTNTKFDRTVFSGLDLSSVRGLKSAKHFGPSSVGIDTIQKSKGKIPEAFLRGSGLSDTFIEYVESFVESPILYYSCFISYSSKNQDFADHLYADLQNNNVRCWLATEDLKIGDKFRTRIEESIRMHDKLLLVLSETSVASPWVESEVESAMERERRENRLVLFPVMLDNAVTDTNVAWAAEIRRARHIGDFRNWKDHDSYKKAFDRLQRDLKAESSK